MALNPYDVAKHHMGLGPAGGTQYGFMLVGAYAKEMQREALGAQDFGGSTDLIGQVPSLARWTQDDFTGGGYQEDWSKDAAMFSLSKALISEAQSRALITVPPLARVHAFDPSAQPNGVNPCLPVDMLRVGPLIFVAFPNGIYRWNITAGTGAWHKIGDADWGIGGLAGNLDIKGLRWEANEQKLYILMSESTTATPDTYAPTIYRLKDDFTAPSHNATWTGPDGLTGDDAYGFTLSENAIILAVNNRLFTGAVPLHPNSKDGTVKWTEIGRLPGRWKDSCSYAGRTYILCSDNHKTTSLVAFDGSSIEPIATFPWNFDGLCITEYAGRLYIGGHGEDVNGTENSAELYEVTGASVRLVRSFRPYAERDASVVPTKITDLEVFEGLLWMNCKGRGLIGYDITSDGLFGGSDYQQSADFDVYKLLSGYGRLWGWGHSDADYAARDGIYRIATTLDTVSAYTGELITSDFVYEPAVKKRLSQLRVMTRYKACTASISTDGGSTWTALAGSETVQGLIHLNTFDLSGVSPTEHWRFKIDIDMGTDVDAIGELLAYTCSFAFLDTGKRAWTITLNGSETIEGRDVSNVDQDVALTASTLWQWAQQQTKLTYTDVDGSTANVHLTGIKESQPVIGPNIPGANRPEAFYAATLIEV